MNAPTQIRIDPEIKRQSKALFEKLGLDLSGAVNIFLHQCLLRGGLPFSVDVPNYSQETLQAAKEAKNVSRDPNAKAYNNIEELKKNLDN